MNPVYLNSLNVLKSLGTQKISDDLEESFSNPKSLEIGFGTGLEAGAGFGLD